MHLTNTRRLPNMATDLVNLDALILREDFEEVKVDVPPAPPKLPDELRRNSARRLAQA
jgi:hypothetical protein